MKKTVFYSLFLFSSCAVRSVYVPTTHNVLLFDNKKQIQANGYLGDNHIELQLAHNPFNHFVSGANTYLGKGLRMYEGYMGIYNYSKTNYKWRFEVLGGVNYTTNFNLQSKAWFSVFQEKKSNYETFSQFNKYFIQPNLGFYSKIEMYKVSYSFSISNRVSYIYFKKYVYREYDPSLSSMQSTHAYIVNKQYYNKYLFLFEPCITNKVGIKNISLVMQGQFMIPSSKEIDIRYTKFSPVFIFSMGLQYNFVFKTKN